MYYIPFLHWCMVDCIAEFSAQNLGGVFFCETIVNVVSIHVDALGLQLESGAIGTAWLIMIILSIVV